jgi:glycosyltransferase involved in cell wall biosynthesis
MSRDEPPRLPHDIEFDSIMRDLLAQDGDAAPPDPRQSPDAFVAWLKESDFPGPNNDISRYLRAVYLSRPDLSRAFPEVPGRDTEAFYRWAHDHGRTEIPIAPPLLPPDRWRMTPRRARRPRRAGVNLVGFLDDGRGIGEVARRIATAHDTAGVPVQRITYPASRGPRDDAAFDTNVVCINPDSLARFVRGYERLVDRRHTIGVWFWETEELPPSFGWAFDYVDEVWAASAFVAAAIAKRAPERVTVRRFDVPIVVPTVDAAFDRQGLGVPDGRFTFLMSFDYLSVVDRKNPTGAIAAFSRAFAPDEGPVLVVKSVNGDERPDDQRRVRAAANDRADIVFVDESLPSASNAALTAQCDCLVSLHRSEGFGHNSADALALGRPVIATGYGANVEYMDGLPGWLVPYSLIDIGEGQHPYPSHHRWADPDIDAAAGIMRQMVAEPMDSCETASQFGHQLTERFSAQKVADVLGDRLADLRHRRWHR